MRVLVCGGRYFDDANTVYSFLDGLDVNVLITGGASGADTLAWEWGFDRGVPTNLVFPADWDRYGKKAGYLRNKEMLEDGRPDLVIAFPGDKGTAMMVRLAEEAGVKVIKVE